MKPRTKVSLAAGAAIASTFLSTGTADAEPVVSSWYGPGFEGNATASGEVFKADGHTAAHPNLPFGTELLVTYGGRQAVVRVTDRGPYADGRSLDLSRAAAEKRGYLVPRAILRATRLVPQAILRVTRRASPRKGTRALRAVLATGESNPYASALTSKSWVRRSHRTRGRLRGPARRPRW